MRIDNLSIILTAPRGCQFGSHRDEFEERWDTVCRKARVPYCIVEPTETEIHGQLLERLWTESVYDAVAFEGSAVLISELDFVPDRRIFRALEAAPEACILTPYNTRLYSPEDDVTQQPGTVAMHAAPTPPGQDPAAVPQVPLTGAWFMLFQPGDWAKEVPFDWLGAAGPFNDAANLAYSRLLWLPPEIRPQCAWLRPKDLHPLCHGVEYLGFGAHLFFARHSDDPDDAVVCWPECARPLTGGLVRRGYQRYLAGTFEDFHRSEE